MSKINFKFSISLYFLFLIPILFGGVSPNLHFLTKIFIFCLFSLTVIFILTTNSRFKKNDVFFFSFPIMFFIFGSFLLLKSGLFQFSSYFISLQFFILFFIFAFFFSNINIPIYKLIYYFQLFTYFSLFCFFIDTSIISIFGSALYTDNGVVRFSPSLGPSAGAIYLISVLLPHICLPRITNKIFHNIISLILILLIIYTGTRIVILSMFFCFLYLFYKNHFITSVSFQKKVIYLLFSLLVLCLSLFIVSQRFFYNNEFSTDLSSINSNGRFYIWQVLITSSLNDFWFGKGIGSSNVYMTSTNLSDGFGVQPHNDYLRIFFEFGFIGLIVFLTFILSILFKINHVKYNSDVSNLSKLYIYCFLIIMLTDNIFIYVFYIYPALFIACIHMFVLPKGPIYESSNCNKHTSSIQN